MRRLVAVLSIAALCTACTNNKDAVITPQPTDDRVEQVAEFQLVGTIESAFVGIEPSVAIPENDAAVSGATDEPDASPVGDPADLPGVLRIEIEDASEDLRDECGVAEGQGVRVYWREGTRIGTVGDGPFPAEIEGDTPGFEDELEGRVAGVSGRVFRTPDDDLATPEPDETDAPTDDPDLTNASPFAIGSPDGRDTSLFEAPGDCILVADQVGFEQEGASETQAPSVRRTAAPTSAPEETDEPTAEPDETEKPKETPLASATPTAEQQ